MGLGEEKENERKKKETVTGGHTRGVLLLARYAFAFVALM